MRVKPMPHRNDFLIDRVFNEIVIATHAQDI